MRSKLLELLDELYNEQCSISDSTTFEKYILNKFEQKFDLTHIDVSKLPKKSKEERAFISQYRVDTSNNHITSEVNKLVYQPNGSQAAPDIHLVYDNISLCVELKISKTNSPLYNSGEIAQNTLYIFNQYRDKKLVYAFGSCLIDTLVLKLSKECNDKCDSICEEYTNEISKLGTTPKQTWILGHRKVYNHNINYVANREDFKEETDKLIKNL